MKSWVLKLVIALAWLNVLVTGLAGILLVVAEIYSGWSAAFHVVERILFFIVCLIIVIKSDELLGCVSKERIQS